MLKFMRGKPWLIQAFVEGGISAHDAIAAWESEDPAWEKLIKEEGLDGQTAMKVLRLREFRGLTLDQAVGLVRKNGEKAKGGMAGRSTRQSPLAPPCQFSRIE